MIESTDPYVYPGTDVLKNLRDIHDPAVLAEFEAEATSGRIVELMGSPTKGNFDSEHLRTTHNYIFQDVYPWAGQFRTVNISKGGHSFARADFIEPSLNHLFRKLASEKQLRGLEPQIFTGRTAYFLGEINAVHPFREGNGRTQREFIRQLAAKAGLAMDWRRVTRDQMTAASRESFLTGNIAGLTAIIKACSR